MQAGERVAHPALPNLALSLAQITQSPRKYGLHATIKPPFRLASGVSRAALEDACVGLCQAQMLFPIGALQLTPLGRFLALCPPESGALSDFAAKCVRDLDRFRAPPTAAELARRQAGGLTIRQQANLAAWGYPYVLEDFRFHITLTGRLPKRDMPDVQNILGTALMPLIPPDLTFGDLALAAEDENGQFHLLRRFPLRGDQNTAGND
jgi:hypothetical protein